MKNFIAVLFLLVISNLCLSQERSGYNGQISFGYIYMNNRLNKTNYYNFKADNTPLNNTSMSGINLKYTYPTNNPNLDIIFGTLFLLGNDDLGSTSWTSGHTNSSDYALNGGSIYAGISPELKGRIFGLTSEFIIGIFSFKEIISVYNNISSAIIDINDSKSSVFGGMSSFGFYLNLGKFGINPSVNGIYAGGKDSFIFYGFNIPVTFSF